MCHSARYWRSVENRSSLARRLDRSGMSWPSSTRVRVGTDVGGRNVARTTPDPTLRIGDAERDVTAAALAEHHAVGRLDFAELEDRLEAVQRARTAADLAEVVRDLPGGDRLGRPTAARPAEPRLRGMAGAIAAFVVVIGFLWVLWAVTGADFPWPIFPTVAWGAGLASRWNQSAPDLILPEAVEADVPSLTGAGPRP